jgi:hypothetical protein
MINNSTNINKTNNHLSPELPDHIKRHEYDIRNPGPEHLWLGTNGNAYIIKLMLKKFVLIK